ncbi:hypothetical protein [Spirochaeta isovalerica]|uniref:Uncharacterized protein n=1 Tax=Spirochaeta isovalerica TaxID=150 RepID=A0A841REB6_9SPIO|nr:hypothetical protein [Spirochaeta isovalerica]MBB6481557.1 hypothetical protein [Spirochaeta isovalerica]
MNLRIVQILYLVFLTCHPLFSAEIDQLTDRDKYQDIAPDFTDTLNTYTNTLLERAVINFNENYDTAEMSFLEIRKMAAFEIFKMTAGKESDRYSERIPDRIGLLYALGKSGHGPIQTWIQSDENSPWWTKLGDNIYSDLLPDSLNKNYIVKVAGEFVGPDKIDHFFDQGYSYWLKSHFGESDRAAIEFGVESENGWYGLKAGGVFSFADLKANWEGYQFFINLFDDRKGILTMNEEGRIIISRPFDWADHVDWQFDELKNPSVMNEITYTKICRYIEKHYDRYRETYDYLKENGILDCGDKRDSCYITDDLVFSKDREFDLEKIMSGT